MKVLILGATGGTGHEVLSQALAQGHVVTALVRRPERMVSSHERLRVVPGSLPDDGGALAAAIRGQDAVISTLGVGPSLRSGGLIARSVPPISRADVAECLLTQLTDTTYLRKGVLLSS